MKSVNGYSTFIEIRMDRFAFERRPYDDAVKWMTNNIHI